jgi:hypothetical protein
MPAPTNIANYITPTVGTITTGLNSSTPYQSSLLQIRYYVPRIRKCFPTWMVIETPKNEKIEI